MAAFFHWFGGFMNVKAALIDMAKDFADRMQKKNMQAYAGSTAFFFILSLIPLLILLSSCLPYTSLTQADLVRVMTELTPKFADDIIERLVAEAFEQSLAVFSISVLSSGCKGVI